jgi:transposase
MRQRANHRILPRILRRYGQGRNFQIVFICSDMWEPYLKLIRENCSRLCISSTAFTSSPI